MEPGDIVIILDEKEHPVFKRSGIDLIMKMPITLSEALTGESSLLTCVSEGADSSIQGDQSD